ncbi:Mu-like prophage major head subunit gpT family protein [Rhizobium sp. CECT 9324]|uniref:Mu-like prophage major head subunit gpT family protein n=1 Tax=Rhizobium sp. CECT 9324 TaxID=2845820 RepID=UPI001E2D6C61|nr:Mu-like prophage major head subunit gpT family protein [Rhizobium sp. CECT 9324]CAH0339580.1 hypothetical protein RHI9324_01231 [Rhizobium sp. CECT 9324]
MARVITPELIAAAQRGFKTSFQLGLAETTSLYTQVATVINSNSSEETYGWLGDFPKLRKWIGDRQIKSLQSHGYSIKNEKFESTIGVERDDIEDDKLGLYAPRFKMMGNSAAAHPDEIAFELMAAGASSACFDGQNFFDTDHPVGMPGAVTSVSNYAAGSGSLWMLADLSKPLKPWIFQKRRDYSFVSKDDPNTSDTVFLRDQYLYGVDARVAAGFGFWQMAFGSTDTLDAQNLREAFTAMTSLTDDEGRKLKIRPTHLIVGSTDLFKARDILMSENIDGSTNTDRNLVQILEAPL